MDKYFYDVEVFPNFFCATFINEEGEVKTFKIFEQIDERGKLRSFLNRDIQLVGFNNISYDGPVIQYACTHNSQNITADLFELSKRLISDENRKDEDLIRLRYPKVKWAQMDLLKIMAFDKLGVGLKQIAINLKWYLIQDLPHSYDHVVLSEEVNEIVDYNINDVLITIELYKAIKPQITLREELSKEFDVDLTNASDSKMANILLEKFLVSELGIDINKLKNLRTKHFAFSLSDCISDDISFQTKELSNLLLEIKNTTVEASNSFAYKKTISFGGCEFELGVGGLHSKDVPGKLSTDSKFIIRDADVASYYPSIMIRDNVKPAHFGSEFLDIVKKITRERLSAKKSGDKTKADGLKITINSIFGKLASDTFWLEDYKAFIHVTVCGQLYLLMLIEKLTLAGIQVVSANTDGIVCKIDKSKENIYKEVCLKWSENTSFELEFTDYELYVRSDVNNYITKTVSGKIKEKGRYLRDVDLKKGYKYPIIAKCFYEYFINGKSVEETIGKATDILDFCISQKSGREFELKYITIKDTIKLQKTNRFYITKSGGALVKRNKVTGKEIGLYVGNTVTLLNKYNSDLSIDTYNIDRDFYIKEAQKYINEIEPKQIQNNMFELLKFATVYNSYDVVYYGESGCDVEEVDYDVASANGE